MGDSSSGLLTDLLKQVSRSFYLTMRVLPSAIRPQIGLAYLLARTTDTIADTQLVPPLERLQALQALRERILGNSSAPLGFGELARQQSSPAEWSLLQRIEESLAVLGEFSLEDQQRIRDLLEPANGPRLRPLYDLYLKQAEEHLTAGWHYTNALPRSHARVRLACAWPLLIGLKTVEKLRAGNVLAPELHTKISRSEVRKLRVRTVLYYPWASAWERLFHRPEAPGNRVDSEASFS